MRITAIIAEYNPFTKGHQKHAELARTETEADAVIAVMSGSFTERGVAAVADKYERAEVAVRLGLDAVIELPLIYAISPADNFAYGAIKTLSAIKDVAAVSFGSECGDAELLEKISDFLSDEPEELSESIKNHLAEGDSYPKARAVALDEYADRHPEASCFKGILDEPNNVLGIAYITQIKKMKLPYRVHTVKRFGAGYHSTDIKSDYPSASAVRQALIDGKLEEAKSALPAFSYNMLVSQNAKGDSLGDLVLFKLKNMDGHELGRCYDVNGGLNNRIKIAADESTGYEEMLVRAKTKKFTMARIRRISLYALFDITQKMYDEAVLLPPYVHVLAVNKQRKDLLASLSTTENLMLRYSDNVKIDKRLRFLTKLDFAAQGTLSIVLRAKNLSKSMRLV